MPHRIDRDTAMGLIRELHGRECTMCTLLRTEPPLRENRFASAVLSRFPTRWGHVLVILKQHRLRLEELTSEQWAGASALAFDSGRAIERALQPSRCYVASLGTSDPDLSMTFPHLHLHVIPVSEPAARPAEVLTWRHGVFQGTEREWRSLRSDLLDAWPDAD